MRCVDGFIPVAPFPDGFDGDDRRRELSFAVVDVLADLGALDWRALGLDDFGRRNEAPSRRR
jgi:hypothetical protein